MMAGLADVTTLPAGLVAFAPLAGALPAAAGDGKDLDLWIAFAHPR